LLETLEDTVADEIPYDYLKSILTNFSKILSESTSREQQEKLLNMLISEIKQ
jgi:site-specific DNA recombinase